MFLSAMARFTATVVFPTPPLPLATAIRFLTPLMGDALAGACPGPGIPGGMKSKSFRACACEDPAQLQLLYDRPPGKRGQGGGAACRVTTLRRCRGVAARIPALSDLGGFVIENALS